MDRFINPYDLESDNGPHLRLVKPDAIRDALARIGVYENLNPELFRFLTVLKRFSCVEKIDHCTFVTSDRDRQRFLDHWTSEGFEQHGVWQTSSYPADHVALVQGGSVKGPWRDMVGLSVSDEVNAPLEAALRQGRSLRNSGTHQLQHIAFGIAPDASMEGLKMALEREGLDFMTDVLSYEDNAGAGLRQMFSAPNGFFFYEFVQRIPNVYGEPYSGFDPAIIDDLYRALDEGPADVMDSRGLVPTSVVFDGEN